MHARPFAGPSPLGAFAAALFLTLALALVGCAEFVQGTERVVRQIDEAGCIGQCRTVKEKCDDNARYDFHQCEAGYQSAQRDYRWCNAADEERCGYPWWSCSENLYGYCTNRFWECQDACRRSRR